LLTRQRGYYFRVSGLAPQVCRHGIND
jgi:hypothetical protein